MATYVGKRVVPIVCGNWSKNREYEMLSIVLDVSTKHSYISRQQVPTGIEITNSDYWSLWTQSLETQAIADEMGPVLAAGIAAVRYEEQNLSETQQEIARHNIGTVKITVEGSTLVIDG